MQEYAIGTSETVLIREVSLFQRLICTQENTIGTSETIQIREVSLFQRLIEHTYLDLRNCPKGNDGVNVWCTCRHVGMQAALRAKRIPLPEAIII